MLFKILDKIVFKNQHGRSIKMNKGEVRDLPHNIFMSTKLAVEVSGVDVDYKVACLDCPELETGIIKMGSKKIYTKVEVVESSDKLQEVVEETAVVTEEVVEERGRKKDKR